MNVIAGALDRQAMSSSAPPQTRPRGSIKPVAADLANVPHLAGIRLHPVKSLEPISVSSARLLPSGGLEGDRVFGFFDAAGKFVNGKRQPRVHLLRSSFDFQTRTLTLNERAFQIDSDRASLEAWLAEHFGFLVTFKEDAAAGFPDDTDAPGPTIISTATLVEVASWFPGVSVDSIRVRFRANLEIGGVEPFWEDRLYTAKPGRVRFTIGDVVIDGNNPCRRCAVPPRDPVTGEGYPDFTKTFMARREAMRPAYAEPSRFDHHYRLAVNTCVPASEAGKMLSVGDEIRVIGQVEG